MPISGDSLTDLAQLAQQTGGVKSLAPEHVTFLAKLLAVRLVEVLPGELSADVVAEITKPPGWAEELVDEHEAARFLRVEVSTLRGWRCRGGGPVFVKPSGRLVRYARRDLLAWCDKYRVGSTSEPVAGGEV